MCLVGYIEWNEWLIGKEDRNVSVVAVIIWHERVYVSIHIQHKWKSPFPSKKIPPLLFRISRRKVYLENFFFFSLSSIAFTVGLWCCTILCLFIHFTSFSFHSFFLILPSISRVSVWSDGNRLVTCAVLMMFMELSSVVCYC